MTGVQRLDMAQRQPALYDPRTGVLTADGIVVTDVADGEFIVAERRKPSRHPKVGGYGNVTVVIDPDKSGVVRVRLKITSPFYNKLVEWEADPEKIFPISFTNTTGQGAKGFTSSFSWVESLGRFPWGDDEGVIEVVFGCANLDFDS